MIVAFIVGGIFGVLISALAVALFVRWLKENVGPKF